MRHRIEIAPRRLESVSNIMVTMNVAKEMSAIRRHGSPAAEERPGKPAHASIVGNER